MRYWMWLARPGWIAGTGLGGVGLAVLLVQRGAADDVPGSIATGRLVAAVLALATAAALLDVAAPILDPTPVRRMSRRLTPPALALVVSASVGGLLAAEQATRVQEIPWSALTLQATGLVTVAVASGAACRGRVDPGLIAPFVVVGLLVVDARVPWGPVLTAAPGPDWARAQLAWVGVIAVAWVIAAVGLRDPAAKSVIRRSGSAVPRARFQAQS